MTRQPRIKPFAEKLIFAFADQMSPAHTNVLLHRDVMLCSYEQIAEQTGGTLGTVKSRLSRARDILNQLRARAVYPNGNPKFADDGTMLDEQGNRSNLR